MPSEAFIFCALIALGTIDSVSLFQHGNNEKYCSADPESPKKSQLPECVLPVDSVRTKGELHPGAEANFIEDFPSWFDPDFAAIGQKYALRNAFPIYYATYLLIIFSFADPEARKVFIRNGHVTSPESTANRFMTNNLQLYLWLSQDIRGNTSNLFQSLHSVRAKHGAAAYKAELNAKSPSIPEPPPGQNPHNIDLRIWKAFEADLNASSKLRKLRNWKEAGIGKKYLLNQFGMSVVLFRHVGLPLWLPDQVMLGGSTDTELEAYLHLWAFLGKAVGVEDEFNICFQPDVKTARIYMKKFFYTNMVPMLFNLDYEAKVLFEYLFKGINNIFLRTKTPLLKDMNNLGDLFLLKLLEDILKIPAPNMRAVLTWFEKGAHAGLDAVIRGHKGRSRHVYQMLGSKFIPNLLKVVSKVNLGLDSSIPSEIAEKAYV